ncbi:MAG: EutP/PduV family microcompartment system protein [Propionicimonas sp.]
MLLGAIGSGKTTFRQRLSNVDAAYAKTQTVYLADGVLDTPGEYLEHGRFNRALLLTSYDADLVLMFQSATAYESKIPPGFATFFTKPVLGIISKIDIASPEEIQRARDFLALACACEVAEISSLTGEGFAGLLPRLDRGDPGTAGLTG